MKRLLFTVALTRGFEAIVDQNAIPLIVGFPWYARSDKKGFTYAAAKVGGKHIYMHRLIAAAVRGQYVDHINRNTLDNRRENLRLCSQSQNMANSLGRRVRGSRYKGVYWNTDRKKWQSQISISSITGRRAVKNLGRYATEEEAARAYDTAARRIFGDFALTNFAECGA